MQVSNSCLQAVPYTPSLWSRSHGLHGSLFYLSAACPELSVVVASCQGAVKHVPSSRRQRDGSKVDIRLKQRALQAISKERPRSLVDIKTYKDTKILVAKFLEHSSCNLPPEVQHVVNSIKCVIKTDERHMEEAIFSANVIDQVSRETQTKQTLFDLQPVSCLAVYCIEYSGTHKK